MFVEDPEQRLKVEPAPRGVAILQVQAVAAHRTEWLGQRLAIARQDNIISHGN